VTIKKTVTRKAGSTQATNAFKVRFPSFLLFSTTVLTTSFSAAAVQAPLLPLPLHLQARRR
jgi:hypothetical protein